MRLIQPYIVFVALTLAFLSCQQTSTGYWKQVGELNLAGEPLRFTFTVDSLRSMSNVYERFYIAPLDRDPDGRLDAIMVAVLDPDTLLALREVRPGAFTELAYLDTSVSWDNQRFTGEIPNDLLLREPLRVWLGSDGRFELNGVLLNRKRGIRMDDPNDPYPFILVHP